MMALLCVLVLFCVGSQTWASELIPDKCNVVYYKNFENLFDSTGQCKEQNSQIVVGDHFVGIIDVQGITNSGGDQHWWSGPASQLTGIFALRVEAIFDPDIYGQQTLPHLVLGAPTRESFCKGGDCFSTGDILEPGEMIAFFRDSSTTFKSSGPMLEDVRTATDGELWLTLGYSSGQDKEYGTADDNGYYYSHVSFVVPLANFTGESWGGLNAIRNHTGYAFAGLNDPNEFEMGNLIQELLTSVHLSNEIEANPDSVPLGGLSPWDFRSNDPAYMFPIEVSEEIECRMTGGGVTEDGEILLPEVDSRGIPIEGTVAEATDAEDPDLDRYQFGGQIGAPTVSQPQPSGEWTHHQQKGPSGKFTFHAGTASAPEGTEIDLVTCSDPGCCIPARPAPAKQIDFEGVGTFKNVQSGPLKGVVVPDKNKVHRTFHWFRAHVEDIGEPGPGGKQPKSPECTHIIGDEIVPEDCVNCPDVYQIEIHESADPTSPVIYSVGGFIDNGNLQIHPAINN